MSFIEEQLQKFKDMIESSILNGGSKGKESMIRSSVLINLIHDALKYELIENGVNNSNIFPPINHSKPELKIAGFLKQKDQDVCVVPSGICRTPTPITWGPLRFENKVDPFGFDYSTNTLVINVRSQMSSLDKNSDTLFERTFAEADNLHRRYDEIVLGEVYLIPVYEYDSDLVKNKQVGFKKKHVKLEKYISFFNAINNRRVGGETYAYERCALLIVDFSHDVPYLYKDSYDLKFDGLISDDFDFDYRKLDFYHFAKDILKIYKKRFDIKKSRLAHST